MRELLIGCGSFVLACVAITLGAMLRGLNSGYR